MSIDIGMSYSVIDGLVIDLRAYLRSLLLFSLTLSVRLSVRLSVCHGETSNRFFFFVYRWNRAIYWPSVLHDALYKTMIFDF